MKSLGSNTARPRAKFKLYFFMPKLYLLQLFLRIVCYLLWELEDTDRYQYQQDSQSELDPVLPPFTWWWTHSIHPHIALCNSLLLGCQQTSFTMLKLLMDELMYWSTLYRCVSLSMVELMCYLDCMFPKVSVLLLLYCFFHNGVLGWFFISGAMLLQEVQISHYYKEWIVKTVNRFKWKITESKMKILF